MAASLFFVCVWFFFFKGEDAEQFLHWNWIKGVNLDGFMPTECKNYTQLEETNKSTLTGIWDGGHE